jgi:23S rRNA pseudouridine2605 synthase
MAKPRKPSAHDTSVRRRKVAERKSRQEGPTAPVPKPELTGEVRLNRFIAQAGMCSRREADAWIAAGRVKVNGTPATEMGTRVDAMRDRVEVDGQPVRPQTLHYVLLNKPKDAITTTDDERGRRTVMDLLDEESRRRGIVPVGRLDRDTTGALLLTNDGDLAHRLMHPRYEIEKLYVVETERSVTPAELEKLGAGVDLDDGPARADQVGYAGAPNLVAVALHEGRNRQVRRMFEALGHAVVKLDRVNYAGLTLDGLRRNAWRPLEPHEINRLRRSVKLKPLVF